MGKIQVFGTILLLAIGTPMLTNMVSDMIKDKESKLEWLFLVGYACVIGVGLWFIWTYE